MKRKLWACILSFVLCFTFVMPALAEEEDFAVEAAQAYPEEATIYYCSYATPELPDGYPGSYTLPVPAGAENVSYQITSGDTLEISSDGLCTPKYETWYNGPGYASMDYIEDAESYDLYHEGSNTVNVSWEGGEYDMTVNVAMYQSVPFEEYVQNTVNTILSEDMTDLQKYEAIAKHVAEEYSYMVQFSGAESMYLNGGGDCWASTDMIITLGTAAGLDVRQRPEVGTSVFGGGHMNAIAKIDGTYYVAESGYTEPKPRYFYVREEPYGMTVSGTTLVNYDGWGTENVIIPDFITTIGDGSHNAFWYRRDEISKITLGAGVNSIGAFALAMIDVSFDISEANNALKVVDGVLYSADGLQLVAVPYAQTSLEIEEGTKEALCNCAYYCEKLETVVFPDSMEKIGEGAFFHCPSLDSVSLPESVKQIDNYAFYDGPYNMTVFADDASFGENVINPEAVIYGHAGSNTETWALEIGASFKPIKAQIAPKMKPSGWMYSGDPFSAAQIEMPDVYCGDTVVPGTWTLCDPDGTIYMAGDEFTYAIFTPEDTETYNALERVLVKLKVYHDLSRAYVYFEESCICDGTAKTPEFILFINDIGVSLDEDQLEVKYSNNKKPGIGKVTITGKGDPYLGSCEAGFYIRPLDTPVIAGVTGMSSGVKITWSAVENAAKYRIYRAEGTGSYEKLKDTASCSFTDKTVTAGTKYKYYVRCLSSDAKVLTSERSAVKTITYTAAPKLSSVTNVKGGVKISWKAVSGAAKYRILRKTGSDSWKKLADTTNRTYTDKSAVSGKTYSYTVRCITSDGKAYTGGYDTTGRKIKYIAAPALPTVKNTSSGVKVTWKKVAGAAKYRVYRKVGSGSWKKLTDTAKLSYLDKTAVKGKTYKYTIQCISADGKSTTSGYNTTGAKIVRS